MTGEKTKDGSRKVLTDKDGRRDEKKKTGSSWEEKGRRKV